MLPTGSGYDNEMTRVVVCGGQSSSRLWPSSCHNLMMMGSRRLTMGYRQTIGGVNCEANVVRQFRGQKCLWRGMV
uniref:Uncharacterized protein n=1 Tax=Romanomermis culicivorax TaxID=13658 RepID=A0A915JM39_ROMCU